VPSGPPGSRAGQRHRPARHAHRWCKLRWHLAVQRVRGGYPAEDVADFLGVDPSSVRRWVAAFESQGAAGLAARPVPGRPRKLTTTQGRIQGLVYLLSLALRVLTLLEWGLPPDLYEKVARGFPEPLVNTCEPWVMISRRRRSPERPGASWPSRITALCPLLPLLVCLPLVPAAGGDLPPSGQRATPRQAPAQAPAPPRHVMIYGKPGRFAGWPANHGIWSWGDSWMKCVVPTVPTWRTPVAPAGGARLAGCGEPARGSSSACQGGAGTAGLFLTTGCGPS
jgi:hypothetical protein